MNAPHQSSGVELLPCPNPWCESAVGAMAFVMRNGTRRVICGCDFKGPERETRADAIAAWNTRAPIDPTTAAKTLRDANLITPEQYNRICENIRAKAVFRETPG